MQNKNQNNMAINPYTADPETLIILKEAPPQQLAFDFEGVPEEEQLKFLQILRTEGLPAAIDYVIKKRKLLQERGPVVNLPRQAKELIELRKQQLELERLKIESRKEQKLHIYNQLRTISNRLDRIEKILKEQVLPALKQNKKEV